MYKIPVCFKCVYSDDFGHPISLTTGNHVHIVFTCVKPCMRDAYGHVPDFSSAMIADLVTGGVWVDGSDHVPDNGCDNFKHDPAINEEV